MKLNKVLLTVIVLFRKGRKEDVRRLLYLWLQNFSNTMKDGIHPNKVKSDHYSKPSYSRSNKTSWPHRGKHVQRSNLIEVEHDTQRKIFSFIAKTISTEREPKICQLSFTVPRQRFAVGKAYRRLRNCLTFWKTCFCILQLTSEQGIHFEIGAER